MRSDASETGSHFGFVIQVAMDLVVLLIALISVFPSFFLSRLLRVPI
jgi:hypothetical protein